MEHSILRRRNLDVAGVAVTENEIIRSEEISVHRQVTENVRLHLLIRAFSDTDVRSCVRADVNDALVRRRLSRTIASVNHDVAAGA